MQRRTSLLAILALIVLAAATQALAIDLKSDLTYRQGDGFVDILKGEQVLAEYVYKGTPRPYIYPLLTPDDQAVTRGFPVKTDAGEPTDHPNQRSFWVGYGSVNGVDFWNEGEKSGTIEQREIEFDATDPAYWSIHTINDWYGPDRLIVCEAEDRRYSFMTCEYGLIISTRINLTAKRGPLDLGGTKDGLLAFRVAPGVSVKGGKGHILNSEGQKDAACWGKRARWIDYTGEVNGKPCGIAIFDVPANYMYPTYWHARDYGLLAANPFGGKDFTGDETSDTGLTIPRNRSLTLTYIALIHPGKLDVAKLDEIADALAGKRPAKTRKDGPSGETDPPTPKTEITSE